MDAGNRLFFVILRSEKESVNVILVSGPVNEIVQISESRENFGNIGKNESLIYIQCGLEHNEVSTATT
jgi:hypothetical protein